MRALNCAEHCRCMASEQLSYSESLRDIEACLLAQPAKLYHMGFRSPVSFLKRWTLSSWRSSATAVLSPARLKNCWFVEAGENPALDQRHARLGDRAATPPVLGSPPRRSARGRSH